MKENNDDDTTSDNDTAFNKNVDLNVYSLKKDDDKPSFVRPIPEPLPGADGECFVLTLVGPRSSGKSVVINNLILREEMMRGLYSDIIIISPTIIVIVVVDILYTKSVRIMSTKRTANR